MKTYRISQQTKPLFPRVAAAVRAERLEVAAPFRPETMAEWVALDRMARRSGG